MLQCVTVPRYLCNLLMISCLYRIYSMVFKKEDPSFRGEPRCESNDIFSPRQRGWKQHQVVQTCQQSESIRHSHYRYSNFISCNRWSYLMVQPKWLRSTTPDCEVVIKVSESDFWSSHLNFCLIHSYYRHNMKKPNLLQYQKCK